DYMTSVKDGGFYGWPYSYWGQHVDPRVEPQRPDLVQKAIMPDYSLSSHVAPLGLVFYTAASLPARYKGGAFVGEHGSWNRRTLNRTGEWSIRDRCAKFGLPFQAVAEARQRWFSCTKSYRRRELRRSGQHCDAAPSMAQ